MSSDTSGRKLAHERTEPGPPARGWKPEEVQSGTDARSAAAAAASPIARGLGWFSIGLGLAQVLAPDRVTRFVGAPDTARTRALTRTMGLREIASGAGILWSPATTSFLWGRVGGDMLDLAALGSALRSDESSPHRLLLAMGGVAGALATDLLSAVEVQDSDAPVSASMPMRVRAAVTIHRTPDDLYAAWRDLEQLPRFMAHLQSVEVHDETHSTWTVRAPLGRSVSWKAKIVEQSPGNVVAWRSLPGSQVEHSGEVRFRPAPGDRGAEVHVELHYAAPAGPLGSAMAKMFGDDPVQQVKDDLRRFKQMMETGEPVRSDGAPGGTDARSQPKQLPAQPVGN